MKEPFDLYSPEIDADPFPYYAALREQYPCYWSESASLWILSRYDDVAQAALDWETFSSSQGNMIDELPGRAGATFNTTDDSRFAIESQEIPLPGLGEGTITSARELEIARKLHEVLASPLGEGVALIVEESYRLLPLVRRSS